MTLEDNLNRTELCRGYYSSAIWFFSKGQVSSVHHLNGPAWVHSSGEKEYRIYYRLHNVKGPAVISLNAPLYYLNNKYLTQKEWQDAIKG